MDEIQIAEISLTEAEIQAAVNVLRSGKLRQGAECEAFENEFAARTGAQQAISCSSGTAALHLAYWACVQPGDEVLVPAFTFFATASMVTMVGAKPVLCDVDRETFLIDLNDARQRLTAKTRAIAPVHLFGNPGDIEEIQGFARENGLQVIWDAAQAHGAIYKGRDIGSVGDFVCYSFYPSKNMFVGEGGMVCTDSNEYAEKVKFLRSHGQTGKYYHTSLGLNYRMTDVEGAIGREQLTRLDAMLAIRRRNATLLNGILAEVPGVGLQRIAPNSDSAWHQYCLTIDPRAFGCDRDELSQFLGSVGIASAIHYPRGVHQQPVFEELYGPQSLPVTEELTRTIIALPVHHGLSEAQVQRVGKVVKQCAETHGV